MAERDFTIGGAEYKLSKINALKQFQIVRRMAPLLGELLPAIKDVAKSQKKIDAMTEGDKMDEFAKLAAPLMLGLGKLSDKDSEMVLFSLLSSVEIKQDKGNWARLANESGLMFDTLELPVMLNAAGRAFMFNLGGFLDALQHSSK